MTATHFFRCYSSVQLGMVGAVAALVLQFTALSKNFKLPFYCCNHTPPTYPHYTFQSSSWNSQSSRKCLFTKATENENSPFPQNIERKPNLTQWKHLTISGAKVHTTH